MHFDSGILKLRSDAISTEIQLPTSKKCESIRALNCASLYIPKANNTMASFVHCNEHASDSLDLNNLSLSGNSCEKVGSLTTDAKELQKLNTIRYPIFNRTFTLNTKIPIPSSDLKVRSRAATTSSHKLPGILRTFDSSPSTKKKTVHFDTDVKIKTFIPDERDLTERSAHAAELRKQAELRRFIHGDYSRGKKTKKAGYVWSPWQKWTSSAASPLTSHSVAFSDVKSGHYERVDDAHSSMTENKRRSAKLSLGVHVNPKVTFRLKTDAIPFQNQESDWCNWGEWDFYRPSPKVDVPIELRPFTGDKGEDPCKWLDEFDRHIGKDLEPGLWILEFCLWLEGEAGFWIETAQPVQQIVANVEAVTTTQDTVLAVRKAFSDEFQLHRSQKT